MPELVHRRGWELNIHTQMNHKELTEKLIKFSPWRFELKFSNGLNTSDLETREPFNRATMFKMSLIEEHLRIPIGADVIDLGSNIGYNSIYLASKYQARVDAIEHNEKLVHTSKFLSNLVEVEDNIHYLRSDAHQLPSKQYDLVLHLGLLYHMDNPYLGLMEACRCTKHGGSLFIETATTDLEDPDVCKYIRGLFGDDTNSWALSKNVIKKILLEGGMSEVTLIRESSPESYREHGLSRCMFKSLK